MTTQVLWSTELLFTSFKRTNNRWYFSLHVSLNAHTPVMWVAAHGENSKRTLKEQEKSTNECALYTGSKQGWAGARFAQNHIRTLATLVPSKLAAITDFFHPNFGKVPTFLRWGPLAMQNNLRAYSISSLYHVQH